MDLLKPILKNIEGKLIVSDREQVVTIDMVHDPETLKYELAEENLPPTFEDQTLEDKWYTYKENQ